MNIYTPFCLIASLKCKIGNLHSLERKFSSDISVVPLQRRGRGVYGPPGGLLPVISRCDASFPELRFITLLCPFDDAIFGVVLVTLNGADFSAMNISYNFFYEDIKDNFFQFSFNENKKNFFQTLTSLK